jgi:monothiol glutaredoxin
MDEQLNNKIKGLINSNKIFLFMKGTPQNPQCGFSFQVVKLLNDLQIKFDSFDIYSDESVRQGVKEFSNWPTYPQLYVDGKLVGGCDIITEMAQNGELKKLLE